MTPSLGLINLLEWLTELRETFYLLGYQFIINGYNSRRARWNRCFGQGVGKGHGASMSPWSTPFSPNLHMFINPEALQTHPLWL